MGQNGKSFIMYFRMILLLITPEGAGFQNDFTEFRTCIACGIQRFARSSSVLGAHHEIRSYSLAQRDEWHAISV